MDFRFNWEENGRWWKGLEQQQDIGPDRQVVAGESCWRNRRRIRRKEERWKRKETSDEKRTLNKKKEKAKERIAAAPPKGSQCDYIGCWSSIHHICLDMRPSCVIALCLGRLVFSDARDDDRNCRRHPKNSKSNKNQNGHQLLADFCQTSSSLANKMSIIYSTALTFLSTMAMSTRPSRKAARQLSY